MKLRYHHIILVLLTIACHHAAAQQYLVVQKTGTVKNYKYQTGDRITLELNDHKTPLSGEITRIEDSLLVLNGSRVIGIKEISCVVRTRNLFRVLSKVFLTVGVGYVALEGINGLLNNYSPVISKQSLIAGGAIAGSGLILRIFKKRKLVIGEKYRIKILDFDSVTKEKDR